MWLTSTLSQSSTSTIHVLSSQKSVSNPPFVSKFLGAAVPSVEPVPKKLNTSKNIKNKFNVLILFILFSPSYFSTYFSLCLYSKISSINSPMKPHSLYNRKQQY